MKKVGLKAIAAAMALLMTASLSAPAAAEAADKLLITSAGSNVLVITQDMVDSEGEFVLSGEDFDKVILPADVAIKNLYVDGCEIGEFTVEGGNNPKVQLWDAQIKNVTVSAANMIDENKAIAEFMEAMRNETSKDTDVEAFVKNVRETNERLAKLIPDIRLMGADMASSEQEIGEVTLAGNAKVNFTKGTNPGKVNVAFKSAQEEMNVTIEGYKGDINVEQTTSVDAPFGVLNLRTKKSEIGDVNVNTQGNANIVLRSTDSKAANVNFNSSGAGSTVLTLSAPTDNLKVAGSASNATVKVLTSLISADVQGKGINMNVGASASVEKATIGGTGNSVSGTGDLKDCTISDGATANVQVPGSTVAGSNTYQPSIFVPSINVNPAPPVVVPTQAPTATPTPAGKPAKILVEGENIALHPMQDQESDVTVDKNTSANKGNYKTAVWYFPSFVRDENGVETTIQDISSVKITFSSNTQICIKVQDAAGNPLMDDAYPNYQVTEMTEATVSYSIASGDADQIHFMSLENDVNIVVSAIEFTYMVYEEEESEVTPTGTPTPTSEPTETPTPNPNVVNVDLSTLVSDGTVTLTPGDSSLKISYPSGEGMSYKRGTYWVPAEIANRVATVKIAGTSTEKFTVNIIDDNDENQWNEGHTNLTGQYGDTLNSGVTASTPFEKTYNIPEANKVSRIEIMCTDTTLTAAMEVVVTEITLTLREATVVPTPSQPPVADTKEFTFASLGNEWYKDDATTYSYDADGAATVNFTANYGTIQWACPSIDSSIYKVCKVYGDDAGKVTVKIWTEEENAKTGAEQVNNPTALTWDFRDGNVTLTEGETYVKFGITGDGIDGGAIDPYTVKLNKIVFAKSADLLP